MGIFSYIIGAGQSGLSGQRAMQQVVSTNIANVNTPGYVRQRMVFAAQSGVAGVGLQPSSGPRNRLLMDHIGMVKGQLGFHGGSGRTLSFVESATNELDGIGLGPKMTEFRENLKALTADPSNTALRREVLNGGKKLAFAFRNVRRQLTDAAETSHYEMKYAAAEINRMAEEVAGLNDLIQNQEKLVGDTGNVELQELVSRRDELISQLGELADVTTVHQNDGTKSLYIGGGRLLVRADLANEVKVSNIGTGPNYDINFTITSLDGPDLDPVKPIGGHLGGLRDAYNSAVRDGINQVDEIAFEFVTEFNARHQAGFGLNGATGIDFFEPIALVDGAAGNLGVAGVIDNDLDNIAAAAAAGNVPGGNGNLVSLADSMTDVGTMPSGSSFYEAWVDYRADITQRIQRATMGVETERATAEQLENLFQNEAGVSLDEEMVMMSQAKTAFDAASQVIRAADEMAQTVLMMVR